MKKLLGRLLIVPLVLLCLFRIATAGPIDDPFGYFNVYSLGNIGVSTNPYTSDFEGITGAAGDAFFVDFLLHTVPTPGAYSLHTGGDAGLLRGSFLHGGIEAYGSVYLDNFYIDGDVAVGCDANDPLQTGGTIEGNVYAAGSVNLSEHVYVSGSKVSGAPFTPTADHAAISQFFLNTSAGIGAMADTTSYTNDGYGMLTIEVVSGDNVVTIDAATFAAAWGVQVIGPADATLYVNVPDGAAVFDSVVWWTNGGITLRDIMVNFPNATSIEFTGLHAVDMLMPRADTYFYQGLVIGTLVTKDLKGDGQVNEPNGGPPIPEPATILLLLAGCVGLAARGRIRRAHR